MSNDLISRSKLIENLSNISSDRIHGNTHVRYGAICRIINQQPTAYDVDEVIDQVSWATSVTEAIDIVKRGGVE